MKCEHCKHWSLLEGDLREEMIFNCHAPDMKVGICCMSTYNDKDEDDYNFKAIAVCNGEGIYGQLITQHDFGCINFKQIVKL